MDLVIAIALSVLIVAATATFHYQALRHLLGMVRRRRTPHSTVIVILTGLVAVHFAEIILYALIYILAAGPLSIGSLAGGEIVPGFIDVLHFATETYSTLGYGDILPTGNLRLIAGVESLNGLLLLAWSGSTLFILVQDLEPERTRPHRKK